MAGKHGNLISTEGLVWYNQKNVATVKSPVKFADLHSANHAQNTIIPKVQQSTHWLSQEEKKNQTGSAEGWGLWLSSVWWMFRPIARGLVGESPPDFATIPPRGSAHSVTNQQYHGPS
jgi:hypothetical protein